jgi:virginiamycin B lyase
MLIFICVQPNNDSEKETNMNINANIARSFVLSTLLLALAPATVAVTVTEANITTANSQPNEVVLGSDGAIWFTEEAASKIGKINPATGAVINEFALTANAGPTGITSLGNFLWFTEQTANRIGRINNATGDVEEFPTNIAGALPNAIAAAADGSLYFTDLGTSKLGQVDAATGNVTAVANVTLSGPAAIVKGPDDNMWISESSSHRISRFNPVSGVLTQFQLVSGSSPTGITVGPDNFIWFTMPGRNRVGKIDPSNSNTITEYSAGISTNSRPNRITTGADGSLWYTTQAGGRIARVTTSGGVVEFTSGITGGNELRGIASDSVTNALFFASAANRIGKVTNLDQIPATIRFESDPFKVSEDCGEATIKVIRDGDSSTAVSVDFATSDSTAKVGDDDYESASGKLNFGVGVTSQTFTVKIKSGGGVESVEDVRLSLLNATGGVEISTPSATLQIFDSTRLDDEGFGDSCDDVKLGGCALKTRRGFDPVLPALLLFSASVLIVQRVMRNQKVK